MEFQKDPILFNDDFMDYLEEVEQQNDIDADQVPVAKRYIRDFHNPMEVYDDIQFKRRYRFAKDPVVHFILPRISQFLEKRNNRGLPISPMHQLLIALRFYATGSFQTVCGDLAFVAQSSVSRVVLRVTHLLETLLPEFIKFPQSERDWILHREAFETLSSRRGREAQQGHRGMPNVDGAIDCTHVRLTAALGQQFPEAYRNRKGYFSINVQAVVGPPMEFLDVVSRWAGSEHDSRIFQNSRVNARYRAGELNGYLLGDGGYPSLPYLLTPLRNPQGEPQEKYNRAHIKGRNVVERTFGVWKRRFPCLSKGLATKLQTSTSIIVACAVLHNISLIVDGVLPDDEEGQEDEEEQEDQVRQEFAVGEGVAVRNHIIQEYFT